MSVVCQAPAACGSLPVRSVDGGEVRHRRGHVRVGTDGALEALFRFDVVARREGLRPIVERAARALGYRGAEGAKRLAAAGFIALEFSYEQIVGDRKVHVCRRERGVRHSRRCHQHGGSVHFERARERVYLLAVSRYDGAEHVRTRGKLPHRNHLAEDRALASSHRGGRVHVDERGTVGGRGDFVFHGRRDRRRIRTLRCTPAGCRTPRCSRPTGADDWSWLAAPRPSAR